MWSKYVLIFMSSVLLVSDINEIWIFPTDFRKKFKYQISWKSVHWEPSCSMRTDRQTYITKLIAAFLNATAPKYRTPPSSDVRAGTTLNLDAMGIARFIQSSIRHRQFHTFCPTAGTQTVSETLCAMFVFLSTGRWLLNTSSTFNLGHTCHKWMTTQFEMSPLRGKGGKRKYWWLIAMRQFSLYRTESGRCSLVPSCSAI